VTSTPTRLSRLVAFCPFAACLLVACGGGEDSSPAPPSITAQPASVSTVAGSAVSFDVSATGDELSYQWQESADGGLTFTNVAGASAATYSIASAETLLNGHAYRVVVDGAGGQVVSTAAVLTVSPAPAQAPDSLPMNCTDFSLQTEGAFQVSNNTWGKGSLTGWSQCVGIGRGPNGSVSGHFNWNWPNTTRNVMAYPALIYGLKPGSPSTSPLLPKQVSLLQELSAHYDVVSTQSGTGNTAFDIWLTNTASPATFSAPPITHEIMIWVDTYGPKAQGGSLFERTTIDGAAYDVFVADHFGIGYRYIAFQGVTSQLGVATINILAFLTYAQANGLITGQEYLSSIEFGNEVVSGSGDTKINAYSVTVQ